MNVTLDDLPGGLQSSSAFGVSGDGSAVVGYGNTAAGQEAFYWTQATGMRRLWDVLLEHYVNPADSGWTLLSQAAAITPDGNVIVGFGIRNGNQEAYRAVSEAAAACPPARPTSTRMAEPTALTVQRQLEWKNRAMKVRALNDFDPELPRPHRWFPSVNYPPFAAILPSLMPSARYLPSFNSKTTAPAPGSRHGKCRVTAARPPAPAPIVDNGPPSPP